MSTIQFGGLASGLDTNTIITTLVQAESAPLTRLKAQQADVDSAGQLLGTFASKLDTLQSAAAALSDPAGFASFSATSSDPSIAASAAGVSAPGSFDVTVGALASEQRTRSDAQSSSTQALGCAGTLSMTIAGTTTNVTLDGTESLADVASKISSSGARVTASVVFDGSTYRLQVRGLDTGAANAITFGESGFSLGLSNAQNTYHAASDAQLTVDGQPITRPTNAISGVIPGVTLALTKTTSSPVTITVATDPASLQQKISTFVSAYNDVVTSAHSAAGYGTQKAQSATLSGDSALRSVLGRLSSLVAGAVPGTSGLYTSLGSVGITTASDGTLKLDSTKLAAALGADPTAVARLFVTDPQTSATGVMGSFKAALSSMADDPSGLIQTRIASLKSRSTSMSDQEDAMQRQVDAYQTQLRNEFTRLEQVVNSYKNMGNALAGLTSSTSTTG